MLFTYLLGLGGDVIPDLLEFLFCRRWVFFEVVNCKEIAREKCQKATPIVKDPLKSYRTDNTVDEATIMLPDFLLAVAGSASPEGTSRGSSSGTWIDSFLIERPAL